MKKKLVLVCLAVALIIGQVHAIDFSIGVTAPGFGVGILRGDAAKDLTDMAENLGLKKDFGLSMSPVVQVNFMIEFLPFLALETGIGFGMSNVTYSAELGGSEAVMDFKRNGIIIPIMVRGQYDFGKFSIYGSIGPKFVIPVSDRMTLEVDGKDQDIEAQMEIGDDYFSKFTMDLGFAIGAEYKLAEVHHIGLRVAYDLNLISPIKEDALDANEFWFDVFGVSLTYRYAF